jgi:hypothetical protein
MLTTLLVLSCRLVPRTPKRGGGSFLPDANGNGATGGKGHDGDTLSNTDILYLKNVILKFIQVPMHFLMQAAVAS